MSLRLPVSIILARFQGEEKTLVSLPPVRPTRDIARGFGVAGEVVHSPDELPATLDRARRATREGKPYLIDARVTRTGVGWREDPWTPTVDLS